MLICLFFSSECNHNIHLIKCILILHLKYYIIYVVSFFLSKQITTSAHEHIVNPKISDIPVLYHCSL